MKKYEYQKPKRIHSNDTIFATSLSLSVKVSFIALVNSQESEYKPIWSYVIIIVTSDTLGGMTINTDFIHIKRFSGELVISQVKYPYRYTLTKKEFIFQKPNMTYHLMLSDIIGMIPYVLPKKELLHPTWQHYQIRAKALYVVGRNGTFEKESADLILPLHPRMVQELAKMDNFIQIDN